VPSKGTIVRATGRAAYKLEAKPIKNRLYSVFVKKALSKNPYIVRKFSVSVKPPIPSVTNSYNNHLFCAHL